VQLFDFDRSIFLHDRPGLTVLDRV